STTGPSRPLPRSTTTPLTFGSRCTSAACPAKMPLGTKQRLKSSARTSFGSSNRTSTSGHTNAIRTRPHCPPPSLKGSPRSASGPNSSIPTDEAAVPRSCNPSPLRLPEFDDRALLSRRGPTRHHLNRKAQSMNAPVRVFQVATGNVGSEMIKRLGNRTDLELVGLHCYSPEKIGRDAGEIVGLPAIGVKATGTIEEIIAAKPDVLTFHGVFPDEDLYVKVLEAGINIVTTADWINGWHRDKNHPHPSGKPVTQLLAEACDKGQVSFYGTGMNPGLNQILGVVCSADVAEIENVMTL